MGWLAEPAARGVSDTVPGDDYTLWFYVPNGVGVSQVRAQTKSNAVVPFHHALNGNSLKVTFLGQQEAVNWEVRFGKWQVTDRRSDRCMPDRMEINIGGFVIAQLCLRRFRAITPG